MDTLWKRLNYGLQTEQKMQALFFQLLLNNGPFIVKLD